MSKPKTIKPLRKRKHYNSEEMERNNNKHINFSLQ